jgi:tetratricopeptide (TPR) repeat protein
MYLRTPKRYQVGRRPKRHLFSTRWLWLWILTPIIVFVGWQVYERREEFGPPVRSFVDNLVTNAQSSLSTVTAPTPLPTVDPAARIARANEAWERGAIEDALQEYEAALENAPNDVNIHYRVAFGRIMEGRDEEGLEMAERTVTANPFSSDAWAIRALALDRNDRPAEAIASALQSLSLNPDNAAALAFMAEAYLDSNLPELAQETVSRALEANPESFEAHYVNGLILQAQSILDESQVAFQTAYDIAPNLPYLSVDLAWSEMSLQNYERAQELLQDVLELNPQNLDALFAMSWLSGSAFGEPQQALEYIVRCTEMDPQNRACLSYQGTLETWLGDAQAALQTYQQLIRTGTTNPDHYLAAGQAYISAGQCQSAVTALEEGYDLERTSEAPSAERLADFEGLLLQCGADISPVFSAEATPEATVESNATAEAQ